MRKISYLYGSTKEGQKIITLCVIINKGLYINDVILFWAVLDTPLLHHQPPPLMTSFIYKISAKIFKIESNQGRRMTYLGRLHLEQFFILYEHPFLILIPCVFWPWIPAKLGPLHSWKGPPPITCHLSSKFNLLAYPPPPPKVMTPFMYSP